MYAGALYAVERGHDLVERIAQLEPRPGPARSRSTGPGTWSPTSSSGAVLARQEWRVASADLTQVLRLDPRSVVVPLEHDHLQVTLIEPGRPLDDLIPIALTNRPEVASQRALVQAAVARVRREKMRPALPVVMINGFQAAGMYLQAGIFGLGPNSSLNQWTGRVDVSFQLMWQLEGLRHRQPGADQGAARRAVAGHHRPLPDPGPGGGRRDPGPRRASSRRRRGSSRPTAPCAPASSPSTATYEGLRQTTRFGDVLVLVYRPQEAVYSLELLNVAFDEYFTTVADYNRAQFELFHALGYPAQEVALQHPTGEILPVDTARPGYLPPVGNGPPPASR